MKKEIDCPISKTAELLSDKWTMLIMRDLIKKEMRFCDLEKSLNGISTRTLTLKLKKLDSEKIIKKTEAGFYTSTKKGRGLRNIENAMRRYGEKYL